METLSRNEQIVKYLVSCCGRINGRVRLFKFIYLADYIARRYLGKPISEFVYRKLDHGPFDTSFYGVLESLKAKGLIQENPYLWAGGRGYEYTDTGLPVPYELAPVELLILNRVIEQYQRTPLNDLLEDIVYETEPMKAAADLPLDSPLDMDSVNDVAKKQIGNLSLETILRSRQEIKGGEWVTFESFIRGLQPSHR